MLIDISSMMMPPPTSSAPIEMPKKRMICCPSNVLTAITQNNEIDAIRIVRRCSADDCCDVRLRKNGIAPTGLIKASSEINDVMMSISSRPRAAQPVLWVAWVATRRSEAALGRRNLPRRALIQLHGHAQCAAESLVHRFHLMMRVQAAQVVDMQRNAGMIDEAAEKFDREIDVERADARTRERHVEFEARPSGKIDHDARQRFVERHVRVSVAANALLVADGLCNGLAKRDADVFDGMVVVDMRIAMRFDVQIDQPVTGDLVEHVIEERHARGQLLLTGAVQVDRCTDLRFAGVANDFRKAHGNSSNLTLKKVGL